MASHVFHKLYYHFVWSTKERLPLIENAVGSKVIEVIETECRKRGAIPIACNTMPDHVHLLVSLPPTITVSTFIGQIKGVCSYQHNHQLPTRHWLKWQDGYGVVTIREAEVEKVIRYISDQQQIHESRKTSRFLETTEVTEP